MVEILRVLGNWWTMLGLMLLFGIIVSLGLVIFKVVVEVVSIVIIEVIAGFKRIWKEETSEL